LRYVNSKDILPTALLRELQKYIQGELIYIPKKDEERRAGWGENNGSRSILSQRNQEIFNSYRNGSCIAQLAVSYSLSEDSIKKILTKENKQRMI
jgi:Mor family transcriptional regulator